MSLIKQDLLSPQENTTGYRQDAISSAVIKDILPILFPNKTVSLSNKEKNKLKFKCFEQIKSILENNGCKIIYKRMPRKDDSYIQVQDKSGTSIRTTFEAFRKRLANSN